MKRYTITNRIILPISKSEAWEFLANPSQLERMTPIKLKFTPLDPLPEKMYEGMIMRYQIRPYFILKFNWVTKITTIQEGTMFIDEQIAGPFKYWQHEHRLMETADGTEFHDTIHYELPFSFLGTIAHYLFVEKMLDDFFAYRNEGLKDYFG